MGSRYSAVLKVSFLGVGDLKVLALGTGDKGERWGNVRELGHVEVMEEMEKASEEMDMGEERPEVFTVLLLYD